MHGAPAKSTILSNLVSPYGLALFSYGFFLVCWLIPPETYSYYVKETDYLYLNAPTFLLYSSCVFGFFAGLWVTDVRTGNCAPKKFADRIRVSPLLFLLLPIVVASLLTIVSGVLLLRNNPLLVLLLLSQRGGELKGTGDSSSQGVLVLAGLVLTGVVWWATWRYFESGLKGWRRAAAVITISLATILVMLFTTLKLNRNELMLVVAGLGILYFFRRPQQDALNTQFVLKFGVISLLLVTSLFALFSFLRGTASLDDQITGLEGYTVASYNRLAAVVNDRLHYPFAGHGMYLSGFLTFNHTFNAIIPIGTLLHAPDYFDFWASEFAAVSGASLDPSLIWSGAFGYIFSDLGWFAPIWVFACGLLYGYLWRLLKRGATLGVVLYPWFGFCILFWFGTNYLLDTGVLVLLLVGCVLWGYERVMTCSYGK